MGGRSCKCLSSSEDDTPPLVDDTASFDAGAIAAQEAKNGAQKGSPASTPSTDWDSVIDVLSENAIVQDCYEDGLGDLSSAEKKIFVMRMLVPLAKASYAQKPGVLAAKRADVLNGYRDFAEKKGIKWRANAKTFGQRGTDVWEAERRAVRKSVGMPDYYRACYEGPLHSYERGNGEWMAAFDAPSKYLLVHLHLYVDMKKHDLDMTAEEAFDKLHAELDMVALHHMAAAADRPIKCLDIGCGVGLSTFATARCLERAGLVGQVTGIDLSDYFIAVAQHLQSMQEEEETGKVSVKFEHGNALDLAANGFGDESVELVILSDVTHEIPKSASESIFAEAARVLAPGGVLAYLDLNPDEILDDTPLLHLIDRVASSTEPYFDEFLELDVISTMREVGLEFMESTYPNTAKYPKAHYCPLRIIIARKALSLTLGTWTGKWVVDHRENWGPYLDFLGVPQVAQQAAMETPDFHEYQFKEDDSFFMDHRIPSRESHIRFTGFLDGQWHSSPYPMPDSGKFTADRKERHIQWKHEWEQFPVCFKTTMADFGGKGKTVVLTRELENLDKIKYTVGVFDPSTNRCIVGPCYSWFKRLDTEIQWWGTSIVQELRERFANGLTRHLAWRLEAIDRMAEMIFENRAAWSAAQAEDNISSADFEAASMTLKAAMIFYKEHLEQWMAPRKKRETVPDILLTDGDWEVLPEAKGVVLIIAPWNATLLLCMLPLLGMVAAGNVCILKPSEHAWHTSRLLARLMPKYFDDRSIIVAEGGKEVAQGLIDARVDHIVFTGSGKIGQKILERAAKHLTPCTLELGGKNPCYVDVASTEQMERYAAEIIGSKSHFCGQFCQAFDYCLVHAQIFDEFVEMLKREIEALGQDRLCRLASAEQARKVRAFLTGQEDLVQPPLPQEGFLLKAGHGLAHLLHMDEKTKVEQMCTVPLSLIVQPELDSSLMTEEIFGPLLPVIKVESPRQAALVVSDRPKPLVCYCFSPEQLTWAIFLDDTSSGNLAFNCGPEHIQSNMNVGFGGVGDSGYGRSIWGQTAFDEFSHLKAIFRGRQFASSSWSQGWSPPGEVDASEAPEKQAVKSASADTFYSTALESATSESAPAESAPPESAPAESAPPESARAESAPPENAPAESAPPESAPDA